MVGPCETSPDGEGEEAVTVSHVYLYFQVKGGISLLAVIAFRVL